MRQSFLLIVCGALVLTGCGKQGSIKTYPVSGTVTYNGKPVDQANVVYVPANPDSPRVSGTTDADGKFAVTTFVSSSEILRGAPANEYKVLVTKMKVNVDDATAKDMANYKDLSDADKMKLAQKMMAGPPPGQGGPTEKAEQKGPTSLLPEKYGDLKTTPLKVTVVSGANDPSEFKLSDD